MQPTYPTTPTEIILADGKTRHLRFSLGAVKRIKERFGKDFESIIKTASEELLPAVLLEGLVERDGISEQSILDDLLTGPMIDYALMQFIHAFFGPRQAELVEKTDEMRRAALKVAMEQSTEAILKAAKPAPAAPGTTLQ